MTMYFDAVLDGRLKPVYNDVPEKVVRMLNTITPGADWQVNVGKSGMTVSVDTYLQAHKERQQYNSERKRAMVRDLVMDVLREAKDFPTRSKHQIRAANAAVENIMGVFGEGEL